MTLLPERPEVGSWMPDAVRVPDPEHERERRLRRWKARTAQWRALELAEEVFGPGVEASLEGDIGPDPFRGLVRLAVPFDGLERHRRREGIFTESAGRDVVLRELPLVFVFEPIPAERHRPSPSAAECR